SDHTWTREIDIEAYRAVSDSAWCDSMPGDAYSVTRREEQRGSRQVPDGEECSTRRVDNGDGTFSERRECQTKYRSEPVYDDRCYFTVNRWQFTRTVEAEGDFNEEPYWPDARLSRSGACIGCEREGNRSEQYLVYLREGENTYTCNLDRQQWQSMAPESTWKFSIGVISKQPDCGSLEPAS
ncbi:MAG: zinc ribbon domain-containing protein, partial [Anaerolineae bacterium]|nr:zinc ribbon domain-containing protein [Anaerolineae bacterium]